jgi:hypothetical protein
LIPVRISAPGGQATRYFEALVDSGAANCMFQVSLASALGLNLASGIASIRAGVSGRGFPKNTKNEQRWRDATRLAPACLAK